MDNTVVRVSSVDVVLSVVVAEVLTMVVAWVGTPGVVVETVVPCVGRAVVLEIIVVPGVVSRVDSGRVEIVLCDDGAWVTAVEVSAVVVVVWYPVVETCDFVAVTDVSVRGVVLSLSLGGVVVTSLSCFCVVGIIVVCTVNGVDSTAVVVNSLVVVGVVVCTSEHGMYLQHDILIS